MNLSVDWRSLDTFRRCSAPGCEWLVQSAWPSKCQSHGGPRFPNVLYDDDGGILASKSLPGSDADEPWEL